VGFLYTRRGIFIFINGWLGFLQLGARFFGEVMIVKVHFVAAGACNLCFPLAFALKANKLLFILLYLCSSQNLYRYRHLGFNRIGITY
jgi:hypothetical protein